MTTNEPNANQPATNLPDGWTEFEDTRGDYCRRTVTRCTGGNLCIIDVAREGVYVNIVGKELIWHDDAMAMSWALAEAAALQGVRWPVS